MSTNGPWALGRALRVRGHLGRKRLIFTAPTLKGLLENRIGIFLPCTASHSELSQWSDPKRRYATPAPDSRAMVPKVDVEMVPG